MAIALCSALLGGSPPATATAAAAAPSVRAAGDVEVLVVAPGKIGTLRMGTTKKKARKRGWIAYDEFCGWGAGRRAYHLDADGDEVFKAYPDKIKRGKVLSFHAMGNVVTSKGVWAARGIGKQSDRLGAALGELLVAYPGLKQRGAWQDYVTGQWWPVYSTGSKKRGWLDFYMDPDTDTAIFVQVRAGRGVKWGKPMFGC